MISDDSDNDDEQFPSKALRPWSAMIQIMTEIQRQDNNLVDESHYPKIEDLFGSNLHEMANRGKCTKRTVERFKKARALKLQQAKKLNQKQVCKPTGSTTTPKRGYWVEGVVKATAPRLIHDPGIGGDQDLMNDLLASIGTRVKRANSITEGSIRFYGIVVRLDTILLDTGALHRSYSCEDLFNNHKNECR